METFDKLIARKSQVDLEIAQCKAAVREMTASVRERGRYAPVKEYNDVQIKVKRLGQESQRLQNEIGSASRVRKASSQGLLAQCFVSVARVSLPQDQFSALLATASLMYSAERNDPGAESTRKTSS